MDNVVRTKIKRGGNMKDVQEDPKTPLTFLVAEPVAVDIKAASAYGYSMEIDTTTPEGGNSDTI